MPTGAALGAVRLWMHHNRFKAGAASTCNTPVREQQHRCIRLDCMELPVQINSVNGQMLYRVMGCAEHGIKCISVRW